MSRDFKLTTTINKQIHTMLKSHCALQEAKLGDFIEAGMILVLKKTKGDVSKIIENFEGDASMKEK